MEKQIKNQNGAGINRAAARASHIVVNSGRFFRLALLLLAMTFPAMADTIGVKPRNAEIVLPESPDFSQKFAAQELQKHLRLVSGVEIEIVPLNKAATDKYRFYVGIRAPGDNRTLALEEARWQVTPAATYLYGDDFLRKNNFASMMIKGSRTGSLFAVYSFLEDQLGIHWIEPGDHGISFQPKEILRLRSGDFDWKPCMVQRSLRPDSKSEDSLTWLKRMRMGSGVIINYGHAFTDWWKRFGQTHPEFFALNEKGKREPQSPNRVDRVKMCASNPALAAFVVQQWQKDKTPYINTCENDGNGYCTCSECRKLDVPVPGETTPSMTDRYVHFSNEVLTQARKTNPGAMGVMYAYSDFQLPPRREKILPGIIVITVPSMLDTLDVTNRFYRSWKEVGATKLMLRPNDMHCNTGLPMGFEKQLFDSFQAGVANGIIGTDYDSLHGYWPVTGIADYVLAKAHVNPEKPFEYWIDEYCSAFGSAKEPVSRYFAYWRENVWHKRIMPDSQYILEKGKYGCFRRGLMWLVKKYYQPEDFDRTDAILKEAEAIPGLSKEEQYRIHELVLANRHSRLLYEALKEENGPRKTEAGKKLLEFRKEHRSDVSIDWARMELNEKYFGDITGIIAASKAEKH